MYEHDYVKYVLQNEMCVATIIIFNYETKHVQKTCTRKITGHIQD